MAESYYYKVEQASTIFFNEGTKSTFVCVKLFIQLNQKLCDAFKDQMERRNVKVKKKA